MTTQGNKGFDNEIMFPPDAKPRRRANGRGPALPCPAMQNVKVAGSFCLRCPYGEAALDEVFVDCTAEELMTDDTDDTL